MITTARISSLRSPLRGFLGLSLIAPLALLNPGCSETKPPATAPTATTATASPTTAPASPTVAPTAAPASPAAVPAAAPGPAPSEAGLAEAKTIFAQRCVACHGEKGLGDGPAAKNLEPKPRVYADAAWQASVTDKQIEEIIIKGGLPFGKSAAMPPNPDLEKKADVVAGLRALIRGFAKK